MSEEFKTKLVEYLSSVASEGYVFQHTPPSFIREYLNWCALSGFMIGCGGVVMAIVVFLGCRWIIKKDDFALPFVGTFGGALILFCLAASGYGLHRSAKSIFAPNVLILEAASELCK